jgi:hypothetical protein
MFWAATCMPDPSQLETAASRDVKGGQITTSTWTSGGSRPMNASTNSRVSARLLCIFQLAAISGLRSDISSILLYRKQSRNPREGFALEQLEHHADGPRAPLVVVYEADGQRLRRVWVMSESS